MSRTECKCKHCCLTVSRCSNLLVLAQTYLLHTKELQLCIMTPHRKKLVLHSVFICILIEYIRRQKFVIYQVLTCKPYRRVSHLGPTTPHNNRTRSQNSEHCSAVIGQFYRKPDLDQSKRGCEMHCGSTRMDVVSAFSERAQGNVTGTTLKTKYSSFVSAGVLLFSIFGSLKHHFYAILLNNASYPHIYKHSSLSFLANVILPLVVVSRCFLNNQASLALQKRSCYENDCLFFCISLSCSLK